MKRFLLSGTLIRKIYLPSAYAENRFMTEPKSDFAIHANSGHALTSSKYYVIFVSYQIRNVNSRPIFGKQFMTKSESILAKKPAKLFRNVSKHYV